MRLSRSLFPLVLLLAPVACTSNKVALTKTSVTAPSKGAGCSFDVMTTRPDKAFDELGVLDVEPTYWIKDRPMTASDFRTLVAPEVCGAGGDAVLAEVNGFGQYVRGTVLRFRK